jgi:transposase
MAEPYSLDLRERVVAACEEEDETRAEIAERFSVSVGFLYAMLRQSRSGQSLKPKPHRGGFSSCVDEPARQKIAKLVKDKPDATLNELCRDLGKKDGPSIKKSRMGQLLQVMGLKRKKDAFSV